MTWRRGLLAFAGGAATVLAFAPFDLYLAGLAGLALLVQLWVRAESPRAAFRAGFWFGLGLFGCGVSWIYVSLHRYGGIPAPLAAFFTLAFCAFIALFPAAAGWLQARIAVPAAARACLLIPALWTLFEWLRGWVLTGFPWLAAGYGALDTPLAGLAPLGGVYAMSLGAMLCAGLAWCMFFQARKFLTASLLVLLVATGAALRSISWSEPMGAVSVSLLQGNVPQDLKFDPARYARTLETYARLAEGSRAQLIVLPETAVPRFFDALDPGYLERLQAIGRRNGGDLLLGVPVRTAACEYFNSAVTLGVSPPQRYDKRHLVPFGEFVPPGTGWAVRALAIPLSDFSRGAREQAPLAAGGAKLAVNVCYEDAFGEELARQLPEATLLANLSNVAWFGDSLAPAQHLQIARARAMETGRAQLAATNTGITAAIDRDGRLLGRLPAFAEGRLDLEVPRYRGATPYVRIGDLGALGAIALLLAACALLARAGAGR